MNHVQNPWTEQLQLENPQLIDCYLVVKYDRGGKVNFVHYIVHNFRKDNTQRFWGQMVNYFRQQKGFKFATLYFLNENDTHYFADLAFGYFDKRKFIPSDKRLQNPLMLAKNRNKK